MENYEKFKKTALKISYIILGLNIILAALKLTAGYLGNSSALVADGINSAADTVSAIIVIIGLSIAGKRSDKSHLYGHERFECVASIVLAVILFATGGIIGYDGIKSIVDGSYKSAKIPDLLALIASGVSIAIKIGMFILVFVYAKKTKSIALKADSKNHLSDIISSSGTLIGIIFSVYGYPLGDVIASLIICLFILKLAFDVFKDAVDKMTDKSCDEETTEKLRSAALSVEGVINIDDIKTRLFGNRIYVDLEFSADKDLTLTEAHSIAEKVHHAIENSVEGVKHCMVHVNPYDEQKGKNIDE